MTELVELRLRNAQLAQQVADAELALAAFARGEVDAVAVEATATPVLLQAAQQALRASVDLLRESEQRYRRIVENTTEGVWMYNAAGVTTFMNTRMADMLGWTVAETVGQPMLTFMQEIIAPGKREITAQRPRGAVERSDYHLRRKDGSALWASIQVTPLYDGEGNYETALCLVSDVAAERTADATRAHLAAIVESSEDSIISASLDGVITSWNRGAQSLYHYTASEMVGRSMTALIPSEFHGTERDIRARVAQGERFPQYETTRVRKDGSLVDVAITFSSIRGTDGSIIGISKMSRDLTARREAEAAHHRIEEQFRQVQKMEAVGRLAGGVAHDFNNVLTVILSYAEFALEDLKQGDPLRDDMLQVKNAGMRAAELTRQLLAFSRQQVLQPRVVALDEVLEGMKVMLQRLLGEDVTLSIVTPAELGHVLADPGQIEQVVMNLAVNARDAMPDGGVLSIQTSDLHLDVGYLSGFAEIPPGDYVVLSVSDTGTGMDATTRLRIFEPFFTTKAPGKGTGLGLSTVFGIVQQSGGYLEVSSELGHGTSFKVYFPRTEGAPEVKHSSGAINAVRGTETILLVEDEDQVRTVGSTILRRHGYNVIEAANGGEAILISQDFAGTIDLLLTDVVMPRMNGRKLREHLEAQRPAMKVLFTSGYTDDAIVHHGVLAAGVAFLQKPFTTNSLLQKVREVLG
ncbi:MAG: PAS domain S-box protein [Kofleriaceae bacterium]